MNSRKNLTKAPKSIEDHFKRFRGLCIIMIILSVFLFALSGYSERLTGAGGDLGGGNATAGAGTVGQSAENIPQDNALGNIANSIGQGLGGAGGGGSMLSGL